MSGNDGLDVNIKSTDLADVSFNHHSGVVVPVEIARLNSIEELIAQPTVGVKNDSN